VSQEKRGWKLSAKTFRRRSAFCPSFGEIRKSPAFLQFRKASHTIHDSSLNPLFVIWRGVYLYNGSERALNIYSYIWTMYLLIIPSDPMAFSDVQKLDRLHISLIAST
jgi:hypothetical protein